MKRALLVVLALVAAACSTIGSSGQGDVDLPSSGVGPFRKLGQNEVPGVDPFVLDNEVARFREPEAMALDDDPASTRVALYAVASVGGHDVIVRTRADDARSFFGTSADTPSHKPAVAVQIDGADVSGPAAIKVNGEVLLYYAAAGGIFLARSGDGVAFKTSGAAVLKADATAPTVARFPDGSFHMLYASRGALWEAKSDA